MRTFRRYCVDVQYVGSKFSGWIGAPREHRNGLPPGVVEAIGKALTKFVGENNYKNLKGSSRTDAGVHAVCNRFHVDICRTGRAGAAEDLAARPAYDPAVVVRAMNFYLSSHNMSILRARAVDPEFNALKNAKARSYTYRLAYNPFKGQKDAFAQPWLLDQNSMWMLDSNLDIQAMRAAAQLFVGEKDFSYVRNAGCQALTPVRAVSALTVRDYNSGQDNEDLHAAMLMGPLRLLTVHITANAFLYRMVRNIVAVLVKVGQGELSVEEVRALIEQGDRTLGPAPAPAHGLFLVNVHFDEESEWDVQAVNSLS